MPVKGDYRDSHLQKGADYDRNISRGDFNTYMDDRENAILSAVISRLFPNGIPRYLDFACGTGRITQLLERMAEVSYGVDVSATMLEQARRKCRATTFFQRDITRERLQIPSVSLISAFRFFGNAQDELRLAAVEAIRAILAEDGYLVVNNHKNTHSVRNVLHNCVDGKHTGGLSCHKLECLLVDNGFRIQRTYGIGWWIVRDKFSQPHILNARWARIIEPISTFRWLAPYCPDVIIVAQKVS